MRKRLEISVDLSKAVGAVGAAIVVGGATAYSPALGAAALGIMLVAGAIYLHGRG